MILCDLIEFLKGIDPAKVCRFGFKNPHSYRGYYEDLAFEPAENVTVGDMLAAASSALGKTFTGYKGGEYVMGEYTDCWLAKYGEGSGEGIGPMLLQYMTSDAEYSLAAMRQRAEEAEADAARFCAGLCVHPKGIIGDEGGSACCPITGTRSALPADASTMGGDRIADTSKMAWTELKDASPAVLRAMIHFHRKLLERHKAESSTRERRAVDALRHVCKHLCQWKGACETGCLVSSALAEMEQKP